MHANENERQALFDRFLHELGVESAPACGFMLCSRIVEDWPDLKIRVFSEFVPDAAGSETIPDMEAVRLARLPGSILLGLYPQKLETLELYIEAEGLHFTASPSGLQKAGLQETHDRHLQFSEADERVTHSATVATHLIERAFKGRFHWRRDS